MSADGQVVAQEKGSGLKRQFGGKKKADTAVKAGKFGIPPLPQVNLMPPEILEGRSVAILKRRLVWAVIALIVGCLLAFGAAYLLKVEAESRHESALAAADTLTAEKRKYAPVVQVQKDINNTEAGRSFALSTEVEWSSLVYAIQAVLPEGVQIENLTINGIGPGDELASGADDLTQAGIAVINFSAISDTLPDVAAWIEALQSVPGLADANIQSSTLQDATGETAYKVAATVQVTEDALANRTFDDAQGGDTATDEPAEEN